jgi:signal transduction histidine kinase
MDPLPPPHEDTALLRIMHELRTPLVVIAGQAQLLARWVRRRGLSDAEAVLARLGVIDRMARDLDARIAALEEQVQAGPPKEDT